MNKKTHEQFILQVQLAHGDMYEIITKYDGATTPIFVHHKPCDTYFYIRPVCLLKSKRCKHCANNVWRKKSPEQFLIQARKLHNDEFEYLTPYINYRTKIRIKHKKCGAIFEQTPQSHLQGNKCLKCRGERHRAKILMTNDRFTQRANAKHNYTYQYLEPYAGWNIRIKMKHTICQHEFYQMPMIHLQGSGCPKCNASKGELQVEQVLIDKNINYTWQHTFVDCVSPKSRRRLRFDFFLPDHNTIIEYDGKQHFEPYRFRGMSKQKMTEDFERTQCHDKTKNQYCANNNIRLLRIPYTKIGSIRDIINNIAL